MCVWGSVCRGMCVFHTGVERSVCVVVWLTSPERLQCTCERQRQRQRHIKTWQRDRVTYNMCVRGVVDRGSHTRDWEKWVHDCCDWRRLRDFSMDRETWVHECFDWYRQRDSNMRVRDRGTVLHMSEIQRPENILKKSARCYMCYVKTRKANFWEFSWDDMCQRYSDIQDVQEVVCRYTPL